MKEERVERGIYADRKLHGRLFEQGEGVCLNRVARLTRLAGITAKTGYKRRPVKYGGNLSVAVDSASDRQFDVEARLAIPFLIY